MKSLDSNITVLTGVVWVPQIKGNFMTIAPYLPGKRFIQGYPKLSRPLRSQNGKVLCKTNEWASKYIPQIWWCEIYDLVIQLCGKEFIIIISPCSYFSDMRFTAKWAHYYGLFIVWTQRKKNGPISKKIQEKLNFRGWLLNLFRVALLIEL